MAFGCLIYFIFFLFVVCLLALRSKWISGREWSDRVIAELCKLSQVSAAPQRISSCSHQSPGPRSLN